MKQLGNQEQDTQTMSAVHQKSSLAVLEAKVGRGEFLHILSGGEKKITKYKLNFI